jgi:hypothetical protein
MSGLVWSKSMNEKEKNGHNMHRKKRYQSWPRGAGLDAKTMAV